MEVSEVIPFDDLSNEYLLNEENNVDDQNSLYSNPIEWRCGEIILLANAHFRFVCTICDENFNTMLLFEDHIKDKHLIDHEIDPTYNDPLVLDLPPPNEDVVYMEGKSDTETKYGDCKDQNHGAYSRNSIIAKETCKETSEHEIYTEQDVPIGDDSIQSLDMHSEPDFDDNEIEEIIPTETKKETKSFAKLKKKKTEYKSRVFEDENIVSLMDKVFGAEPQKTTRTKKVYSCSFCDHIASCNRTLENHLRKVHDAGIRYQCDECGKLFGKKYYLQSHMITHSGERPYKCDLCESSFAHRNSLKSHSVVHTVRQQSYSCNICDKKFISKNGIIYHMRDHTGDTPFVCLICERKFTCKSHLNKHMLDHSGRLDFKCEECGKAFKYKAQLKSHVVYHTKEKNFVCDLCPLRFSHKKNLLQHKKIHLDVKQYTCKVCGKEFAQYPGLYSHMKYHKKRDVDD